MGFQILLTEKIASVLVCFGVLVYASKTNIKYWTKKKSNTVKIYMWEHCGDNQYKYQILTLTVNIVQPRTKKTSKQRVMKPNCPNTGNIVIGLRRLFEKTDLTQNGRGETTVKNQQSFSKFVKYDVSTFQRIFDHVHIFEIDQIKVLSAAPPKGHETLLKTNQIHQMIKWISLNDDIDTLNSECRIQRISTFNLIRAWRIQSIFENVDVYKHYFSKVMTLIYWRHVIKVCWALCSVQIV